MSWTLTHDVEEFAERALPSLSERPVDNTLVLTISDTIRTGRQFSEQRPIFGWCEGPGGFGGLVMTPPYEMVISFADPDSIPELVTTLREQGVDVPGVNADGEVAERFGAEWLRGTSIAPTVLRRQRLYRLGELREPNQPPEGQARRAREDEVALLLAWMHAFVAEVHLMDAVSEAFLASRIADDRVWMWENDAGTPVAFAGRQKTIGGVARIGPVYTPPAHRRRSYGAGVTHACTADAIAKGATEVALFTDLANPTSNSIYQQIGFEPLSDSVVLRFDGAQA